MSVEENGVYELETIFELFDPTLCSIDKVEAGIYLP